MRNITGALIAAVAAVTFAAPASAAPGYQPPAVSVPTPTGACTVDGRSIWTTTAAYEGFVAPPTVTLEVFRGQRLIRTIALDPQPQVDGPREFWWGAPKTYRLRAPEGVAKTLVVKFDGATVAAMPFVGVGC